MIKIWNGGPGLWTEAAKWQGGAPVHRDLAIIPSGSAVDCTGAYLSGTTLLLQQTSDKSVLFSLNTATLGANSSITTLGDVTFTLQDTMLFGTTYFSTGSVSVPVTPNSSAVNAGTMIVYSGSGPASVTIAADRGAFTNTGIDSCRDERSAGYHLRRDLSGNAAGDQQRWNDRGQRWWRDHV